MTTITNSNYPNLSVLSVPNFFIQKEFLFPILLYEHEMYTWCLDQC